MIELEYTKTYLFLNFVFGYSTQSRLNQLVNMLFQCFMFMYIMYLFTLCLSVKPNINLYIGVLRENMRQIKHRPVMLPYNNIYIIK